MKYLIQYIEHLYKHRIGAWNQWKYYKLSFRILQGAWCLAAFVLVNAYSSTIISYLTAPKLITVAETLDQVALGYPQNLKLLIEKDNIMTGRYLVCLILNIYSL